MSQVQQRINEIIDELPDETTPKERAKALRDIMQATTLEIPFQQVQRIRNNKLKMLLQQCSEDIESYSKPHYIR